MEETALDSQTQAAAKATAKPGKYLTFKLSEELYGLEILKVQEIIGLMSVTHVPRTPTYVRGVINLRGKVIPVIDLRLKFELASIPDTERTCIIVLQVARQGGTVTMGTIVDEVSEVLEVRGEQIEPAPSFGASVNTDFLLGVGKVDQKVVMLLDVDEVLAGGELGALDLDM